MLQKGIALAQLAFFSATLPTIPKWNFLYWTNILSLDAPVVAVVWQGFFADLFDVEISFVSRCVLGLTIWLAYVADRWLDGCLLPTGSAITLRHRFAQQHGRTLAAAWIIVFVANFIWALNGLSSCEFVFGLALASIAVAYLFGVHVKVLRGAVGASKEMWVAVLFSLGAGVFVFPNLDAGAAPFWGCLLILAALCFVNCLLVSSWEREEDAQQAQPSMAIRWKFEPRSVRGIAVMLMFAALAVCLIWWGQPVGWTAGIAALSFLLLGLLDVVAEPLSPSLRRLLADAALLSPLVTCC